MTDTNAMTRRLKRCDEGDRFVTRHIAGETVIVPVSGSADNVGAVYTLNEVGSFVWRLIDGRRSVREIAEAVGSEFAVAPDLAAHDVDELVTLLEAKGLIGPADAAQGTS